MNICVGRSDRSKIKNVASKFVFHIHSIRNKSRNNDKTVTIRPVVVGLHSPPEIVLRTFLEGN
jgi:hypothetical protein